MTTPKPGFDYEPDIQIAAAKAQEYAADPNMSTLFLSRLRLFETPKNESGPMPNSFDHNPDIIKASEKIARYAADPNMRTLWESRLKLFETMKAEQSKDDVHEA